MSRSFIKMHGAGNDFIIFDARHETVPLTAEQVRRIAARGNVITKGCDQVIAMESSRQADVFMRIYNADGSEVNACGNATRCVGWLIMEEKSADAATVHTHAGLLHCMRSGKTQVTVEMGAPSFDWRDIPLSQEMDTLHTGIRINDAILNPVAVSMGNPHAVFFVNDPALLKSTDMATVNGALQAFFPQGVNVSIGYLHKPYAKQATEPVMIDVRVWERGVGETPACGTAACAVMAAAWMRSPIGNKARIRFQPSEYVLEVEWPDDGSAKKPILLTGPVQVEFTGMISL